MARSWADIDLAAIAANVKSLCRLAPGAELCAVVKADGYGHGSVDVARVALAAGATRLAVAQVGEGIELRGAGFEEPIWILSEPAQSEWGAVASAGLEPAVYSFRAVEQAAAAALGEMVVHLKVDTGMHRVGAQPVDVVPVASAIVAAAPLRLGSVWTHLASADAVAEPDRGPTDQQLDRYEAVLADLEAAGIEVPLRHAANSAGTIAHARSHHDVVRCGISLYGLPPSPALADRVELRPALTWRTEVSFVKRVAAGEALSYGHRQAVVSPTTVATLPVGYADGYRRGLWDSGGCALIGGRRRPILGVVTMDQTLVDCGDDEVVPGDEAVLIGRQGDEEITADELAEHLGTINYEIPVAIGRRVERRFHGA